ncbi:fungal-specific transcription factor domain-containing protein [Colletotrichum navitas]|uniref:Fungal-specific transcription factor domain-containing protein n=1 Tax=Colletotrichum navitas TaxID=681940 RepID=A0AAD8V6T0_9PEZI|nr:fungal-specific transcription factor domain-containing protein [Colletotrichum navitas]KAK1594618.1 fungal-specific transcription factor domain-containing protein [Colletotrichum navitas]
MMQTSKARHDAITLPKKRCGTCIGRKISCDRRFPRCSSCVRSNRVCTGYGLRLSWPRKVDGKRIIVGKARPPSKRTRHTDPYSGQFHMINATFWDIELHQNRISTGDSYIPPLRPSLPWSTSGLSATEQDLFYYFQNQMASWILSFSNKPLGPTLLRLAASGQSFAAVALKRSLVALASQFRYGPGMRGEELKLSAIRALAASASQGIESQNAIQHVAAVMVLCLFESQQSSTASDQWLCYLRAAGKVIESVTLKSFGRVTDGPILLEWVYYHEVLARFSIRHWRQHHPGVSSCQYGTDSPSYLAEERARWNSAATIIQWQGSTVHQTVFAPLRLLSRVVSEILPSGDPNARKEAYKTKVARLKQEIRNLEIPTPADLAIQCVAARAEVFRITTLVYLSRSTDQDLLLPSELELLVDKGLSLMKNVGCCERPLPLLILGCEARTDIERLRVLDLIPAPESRTPWRKHHFMTTLLPALWIQNDLDFESNVKLDYTEKLSAVFNASEFPPQFH